MLWGKVLKPITEAHTLENRKRRAKWTLCKRWNDEEQISMKWEFLNKEKNQWNKELILLKVQ